jgi:hypothetical protein
MAAEAATTNNNVRDVPEVPADITATDVTYASTVKSPPGGYPSDIFLERGALLFPPLQVSEATCAICCEVYKAPVATQCNHTFCNSCLMTWVADAESGTCPTCRGTIDPNEIQPLNATKKLIEHQQICCPYRGAGCEWESTLGLDHFNLADHLQCVLHGTMQMRRTLPLQGAGLPRSYLPLRFGHRQAGSRPGVDARQARAKRSRCKCSSTIRLDFVRSIHARGRSKCRLPVPSDELP